MNLRNLWALPLGLWLLATGCAYEFSDRYCMEKVRFRRDPSGAGMHDLEPGEALMIILRDQTPGYTMGAMNTVKLGIEIPQYDLGVPIQVEKEGVVVRFSDLDGIPPTSGTVGFGATGILNILKMSEEGLLLDIDIAIRAKHISGGTDEITVDDKIWCRWLPPDVDKIPPYLGGTKEHPQ